MVAYKNHRVEMVSLEEATRQCRTVRLDCDTVATAREMGLCFGDEPQGRFSRR
jgi:6-phosphofructokinase 1